LPVLPAVLPVLPMVLAALPTCPGGRQPLSFLESPGGQSLAAVAVGGVVEGPMTGWLVLPAVVPVVGAVVPVVGAVPAVVPVVGAVPAVVPVVGAVPVAGAVVAGAAVVLPPAVVPCCSRASLLEPGPYTLTVLVFSFVFVLELVEPEALPARLPEPEVAPAVGAGAVGVVVVCAVTAAAKKPAKRTLNSLFMYVTPFNFRELARKPGGGIAGGGGWHLSAVAPDPPGVQSYT
jgi:hypothetical protein